MSKRSDFKRRKHDQYMTPVVESIFKPLVKHLPSHFTFIDPCFGSGHILAGLQLVINDFKQSNLCAAYDINPTWGVDYADATKLKLNPNPADYFITNPPWTRQILHPIIENLADQLPTWLLFDADWMHTKQAIPYLQYCHKIVVVGRVSWMENKVSGKDNVAWYLFDHTKHCSMTKFYGHML